MAISVVIVITLLLLPMILAMPIILRINTESDDYSVRFGGLCSISAIAAIDKPGIRLRIGFWKRQWNLADMKRRKATEGKSRGAEDKSNGKKRSGVSIKRIWRVIRAFKVSQCDVMLDTDDYVLNAQLFPLFQFCNNRWGRWQVNFEGNCRLQLEFKSRLIRVLYAWWGKT